ncbi:MAG: glycosyltransferase family 4 protein, partial [Candidatus Binataceae bacterium]
TPLGMDANPGRGQTITSRVSRLNQMGIQTIPIIPAARAKRAVALVAIYGNPDHYPPTFNAVRILANYFKVHIVCRQYGEIFRRWPAGVTVERLGEDADISRISNKNPLAKWLEYKRFVDAVREAVRRLNPAFIYAYEAHGYAATIRSGASEAAIPILLHFHEMPEIGPPTSLQSWIARYALGRTKLAGMVIFTEKFRAGIYCRKFGDTRTPLIVPNCSALDFFPAPPDWRELLERRWAAKELLHIGAIGPNNGHREALHALAILPPEMRLRFIGGGRESFKDELRSIAIKLGVADRFKIESFVAHGDLAPYAASGSVGLSLYKSNGANLEYCGAASNKTFEYAAAGLPAIVPDRISYRDFFKDEPWITYVNQEDPDAIARGINFILEDRERYFMMSHAARRAFEQRFNYECVFEPLLQRILGLANPSKLSAPAAGNSSF